MFTDLELIEAICSDISAQRNKALRILFEDKQLKEFVRSYVLKNGGVSEDAEDIFQETLINFEKNIRSKRFKGNSSLRTYFIGIAKMKWYGELRKQNKQAILLKLDKEHDEFQSEITQSDDLDEYFQYHLNLALAPLGEMCQKLIMALYQNKNVTYEELVEIEGFECSSDTLRKDVYRCRQRLYRLFEEKPDLMSFLKPIIKK